MCIHGNIMRIHGKTARMHHKLTCNHGANKYELTRHNITHIIHGAKATCIHVKNTEHINTGELRAYMTM